MNILTFDGNLGRDSELRYTQSGKVVCSFSVACTSGWGDNKHTSWITCSLWGQRGESLGPMLLKGQKVVVSGEFSDRVYDKQGGGQGYSLELNVNEVVLCGEPRQGNQQQNNQYQGQQNQQQNQHQHPHHNGNSGTNEQQQYQQPQNNQNNQQQQRGGPAPQHKPMNHGPKHAQNNQAGGQSYEPIEEDDDIPF